MPMRLRPVGLLLLWVGACHPQESIVTSVEVTDGSDAVARQHFAEQVLKDLASELKSRVLRRVPGISINMLNGLAVSLNVQNDHAIDGQSKTIVTIDCAFTHDGTVSDAARIVGACRDEVRHAVADRVARRPL